MKPLSNRWVVASVFYLSSALNYLDRLLLGSMAPHLMKVLNFNAAQYGDLQSLFYIVYSVCSPIAGFLIDKVGLNRGISVALALWSVAGILRGYVDSYWGLVAASCLLAIGESAGIPSTAKFAHRYLRPQERAIGAGMSQLGLAVGGFLAPVVVSYFVTQGNWQYAFVLPGIAGFVWIAVWLWVDRHNKVPPPDAKAQERSFSPAQLLREPGMWGLYLGNIAGMVPYALWSGNWTTLFFTQTYGLTIQEANSYAKYTHLVNYAGALFGGWLSGYLVQRGWRPASARIQVCGMVAVGQLVNFAIPNAPDPGWAALGICASYAFAAMFGVNFYTIPVDRYGHGAAAFSVSLLTSAFGVLQVVISPWVGRMAQSTGFGAVCALAALSPLLAYAIVQFTRPAEERQPAA